MARGMRYDLAASRARQREIAHEPRGPFRAAPRDKATRKQLERVAQIAAELGVEAPKPRGPYLTRKEAGRFIDAYLIGCARDGRSGTRAAGSGGAGETLAGQADNASKGRE